MTGFNDIFVSIAILLVLGAAWYIGAMISDITGAVVAAALAWGLAEYFSRMRRLALYFIAGNFGLFVIPLILMMAGAFVPVLAIATAYAHWWRFKIPDSGNRHGCICAVGGGAVR